MSRPSAYRQILPPRQASRVLKLTDLLHLARPHQYTKNLFIYLPLFFGHSLLDLEALYACTIAAVAFSLISSGVYVFNDLRDIESDRRHPVKKFRPLAMGRISPGGGYLFAAVLFAV